MNDKNDYIEAAHQIIIALGLPRAQQNERSALSLLALLNLTPGKAWADAENPLVGITPIMDWARERVPADVALGRVLAIASEPDFAERHVQLGKFYAATDTDDLIDKMEQHITRLQDKVAALALSWAAAKFVERTHMSDEWFDAARSVGEYPRKGYGWQTDEQQRAEIQRRVSAGQRDKWVLDEAMRFRIHVPCRCGNRAMALCPGEWEPGCDLGANEKFVRAYID